MSREKIEQYFNLLVNKFVKLDNRSSLKIVFEDNLNKYGTDDQLLSNKEFNS
jgi:hypothetical protein